MNNELEKSVNSAKTLTELEDIYLPYRPKRRTRATIAKEKGLEPLTDLIFEQSDADPKKFRSCVDDKDRWSAWGMTAPIQKQVKRWQWKT